MVLPPPVHMSLLVLSGKSGTPLFSQQPQVGQIHEDDPRILGCGVLPLKGSFYGELCSNLQFRLSGKEGKQRGGAGELGYS